MIKRKNNLKNMKINKKINYIKFYKKNLILSKIMITILKKMKIK